MIIDVHASVRVWRGGRVAEGRIYLFCCPLRIVVFFVVMRGKLQIRTNVQVESLQ